MHQQLQAAGRRLAPTWAAARARRYERALREAAGMPQLARRVIERIGDQVIDGPCAGLRYPTEYLPEVDAPVAKLVGSYERQLHEPLARAIDSGRSPFIDIGCADGYYAVGLALRRRDLAVHAYDHARSARSTCAVMAAVNECADRVSIQGHCNARRLRRLPLAHALVLADIEGAEFDLFSEEVVSLLGGAVVVVELHRPVKDPAAAELLERFTASHNTEIRCECAPDPHAIAALSFLDPDERVTATDEGRGERDQTWLVLTPHRT